MKFSWGFNVSFAVGEETDNPALVNAPPPQQPPPAPPPSDHPCAIDEGDENLPSSTSSAGSNNSLQVTPTPSSSTSSNSNHHDENVGNAKLGMRNGSRDGGIHFPLAIHPENLNNTTMPQSKDVALCPDKSDASSDSRAASRVVKRGLPDQLEENVSRETKKLKTNEMIERDCKTFFANQHSTEGTCTISSENADENQSTTSPTNGFFVSDSNISTQPTCADINEKLRTSDTSLFVPNLTITHQMHGSVTFLGYRNLLELRSRDLSEIVKFEKGTATFCKNIIKIPTMITFRNITRQDFAAEIGANRVISDEELCTALHGVDILTGSIFSTYNEDELTWSFIHTRGEENETVGL